MVVTIDTLKQRSLVNSTKLDRENLAILERHPNPYVLANLASKAFKASGLMNLSETLAI